MAGKCEACGKEVRISTAHHEVSCEAKRDQLTEVPLSSTEPPVEDDGSPIQYYAQLVNVMSCAMATQAGHQMVEVEISILGAWKNLMSKDFRAAFWDRAERGPYECLVMVARELLNARQLYPEIESFLGESERPLEEQGAFPNETERSAAAVEFFDSGVNRTVEPAGLLGQWDDKTEADNPGK